MLSGDITDRSCARHWSAVGHWWHGHHWPTADQCQCEWVSEWVSEWVVWYVVLSGDITDRSCARHWSAVGHWWHGHHWPSRRRACLQRSALGRSQVGLSRSNRCSSDQDVPTAQLSTGTKHLTLPPRPDCTWCGDGAGNTIEENCSIFSLVAVSKGTWTVHLCSNKILQLLTGGAN